MREETTAAAEGGVRATPANRLGLDFAAEASLLPPAPATIIDVHCHVNGPAAARIYRRAAELYGIGLSYSMTKLEEVETIRSILGDRVRFIAERRSCTGSG